MLTSKELAQAPKENLYYHCLGQHAQKDCLQLHGSESVKVKSKDKAMHTVHLLALEAYSKYLVVQHSHQPKVHDYFLTTAPWQPHFGPCHELFCLHGTINK